MRTGLKSLMGAAALLSMSSIAEVSATPFSFDDGTSEAALGLFGGQTGNAAFFNLFDAGAGATITDIQYGFGSPNNSGVTAGVTQVTVFILDDVNNDGLPNDIGAVLASAVDMPTEIDNDVFNDVLIAPTFVTGNFFVGILGEGLSSQAIIGVDNDTFVAGQGFGAIGTALDINGDIPGTADLIGLTDLNAFGFGAPLLRANTSTAVSEPLTAALFGLGLAGLGLRRRSK